MISETDIKEEDEWLEVKVLINDETFNSIDADIGISVPQKDISINCEQCDYIAKHPKGLKRHVDFTHKGIVFMCDQCDYFSSNTSNLNSHKKSKHDMRVYKCIFCDLTTSFKQYLQKHIKEKHGGEIVFFCSDCDFHSKIKQQYEDHKQTEHATGRVKPRNLLKVDSQSDYSNPPKTDKERPKSNSYKNRKPHSTFKPFKCDLCDYSTTRQYNVTVHKQSQHELQSIEFYCEVCTFSTTKQAYLTRHLEVVHNDVSSKRSYPLFTPREELPEHKFFSAPGSHMPHLWIDGHALVMNKFFQNGQDEKCGYFYCVDKIKNKCKVSAKAYVTDKHIDVKSEVDNEVTIDNTFIELSVETEKTKEEENEVERLSLISYQGTHAQLCTKVEQDQVVYKPKPKPKLNSVSRVKSKITNKLELCCDLCEYKATSMSSFGKHRQVKHEKLSFSCDQCEYQVKYKASLHRHVKAVHEGRTYDCTLCEFKSTTKSHLKIHTESVHEGKTYDCEHCDKKFKQRIHLKTHFDGMHKGVTYACTYCSYISRQKGHLKHHIATKHEGNPHKCDVCGVIYAHNGQLKLHKVREHGDSSYKKKFECDQCEFSSHEEMYLKRHIQRRHDKFEGKKRRKRSKKKNMENKMLALS